MMKESSGAQEYTPPNCAVCGLFDFQEWHNAGSPIILCDTDKNRSMMIDSNNRRLHLSSSELRVMSCARRDKNRAVQPGGFLWTNIPKKDGNIQ